MRAMLAVLVLIGPLMMTAQVTSSTNLGCTAYAPRGMSCNGIGVPDTQGGTNLPKLFVTHFRIAPGAQVEEPSSSSDCLIIGINGGDLVNEKPPFLHVSLEKDAVTLMPREQPFRLRNKGSQDVEFRLLEIRR
jgi:hypothetical protein